VVTILINYAFFSAVILILYHFGSISLIHFSLNQKFEKPHDFDAINFSIIRVNMLRDLVRLIKSCNFGLGVGLVFCLLLLLFFFLH